MALDYCPPFLASLNIINVTFLSLPHQNIQLLSRKNMSYKFDAVLVDQLGITLKQILQQNSQNDSRSAQAMHYRLLKFKKFGCLLIDMKLVQIPAHPVHQSLALTDFGLQSNLGRDFRNFRNIQIGLPMISAAAQLEKDKRGFDSGSKKPLLRSDLKYPELENKVTEFLFVLYSYQLSFSVVSSLGFQSPYNSRAELSVKNFELIKLGHVLRLKEMLQRPMLYQSTNVLREDLEVLILFVYECEIPCIIRILTESDTKSIDNAVTFGALHIRRSQFGANKFLRPKALFHYKLNMSNERLLNKQVVPS